MQQRHKQLVERQPKHGRFVRRLAGVGAVVDGIAALGDALDGEDGKLGALVVVAGVVAIRAFQRVLVAAFVVGVRVDVAFQHDFGAGWHLQRHGHGIGHFGAGTAQQAGKLVLRQRIGHGRDRAQDGRRIGPDGHRHGVRLAGVLLGVLGKVQRSAPVRQPAHDELVMADHLLAVDAQVLPLFMRPTGDGQPPGDERGHIAGPAVLDGQPR